jgi:hypothetical protein
VTLDRRRKATEQPPAADSEAGDQPTTDQEEVRAASEAARRDVSERADELLARLRKL